MRTVNPDAYDLYLKGRFYGNQRNPAAIKESIGYLQRATEKILISPSHMSAWPTPTT
jgi:hypothetical protein